MQDPASDKTHHKPWLNSVKIFFLKWLAFISLGTSFLSVLALGGRWHWLLDFLNHFRPLFAGVLLFSLVFLWWLKARRWVCIGVAGGLCLNGQFVLPLYWFTGRVPSEGLPFTVMQFNTCAPLQNKLKLSSFLHEEFPELVVLEECNEACFKQLITAGLDRIYPYQYQKQPLRHRLVVLSQWPILQAKNIDLPQEPAFAYLQIQSPGESLHLMALHSTRPTSGAAYYHKQMQQFEAIAAEIRKQKGPLLLMGDLNTTPWGYSFRKLLKDSGLNNSMRGFGWQPSFPVFVPRFQYRFVRPVFPIDHILHSSHIQTHKRWLGPDLDSDHLPVLAELTLAPNKQAD